MNASIPSRPGLVGRIDSWATMGGSTLTWGRRLVGKSIGSPISHSGKVTCLVHIGMTSSRSSSLSAATFRHSGPDSGFFWHTSVLGRKARTSRTSLQPLVSTDDIFDKEGVDVAARVRLPPVQVQSRL
eukprot:6475318-Amphidinium_carterae.4